MRWKAFFYINPAAKICNIWFENVEPSPENSRNGFLGARLTGLSLQNFEKLAATSKIVKRRHKSYKEVKKLFVFAYNT